MSTNDDQSAQPTTFEGLKLLITDHYPKLSGQLQRIARYVLENPNDAALETVSELARRVKVQPSSLVRFAKTLGYDGYSNVQTVLRSRLISEIPSYRDRIRSLNDQRGAGGTGVLDDFVDDGIAALDQLRRKVSEDDLAAAAEILNEAEDVYVLAQGRAFPVAQYLAYALTGLEVSCQMLDGLGGLTPRRARLAGVADAMIAISFRPYTSDVVDVVAQRKAAGVPIIALTDSPLSPLALNADIVLETAEDEGRAFRSLVAPMCLAQSLMVTLGHRITEKR
jgi:DNA-binding MurR/RpiR family transcriptional regulator